ncbi:hypothetical protein [Paenibacillus sp. 1P07SE]|uniref:hypothetical protein n=1 Tax=Paenibacillus sp. 1P07SE TaxID=3132209 RepID=UPI0039A5FAC8
MTALKQQDDGGNRSVRLQNVLELWYVWLSAGPAVLCGQREMERMEAAVRSLSETGDFMESSAIVKADWFLNEGSQQMLERIREDAYDSYE